MDALDLNPDKYRLIKALRPFSYSVALVTCSLGIVLAYHQGNGSMSRAVLVILAGLLLQAATNLANDHADITLWRRHPGELSRQVIAHINFNFRLAGVLAMLGCAMGLWLVREVGWPLLVLGVVGVIGGYCYTGEPVNYKERGLGVPAVFLFTGVLMVTGAYFAVGGVWSHEVVWASIPVSMLSSTLILANEIRDYLDDTHHNIRTLTVRIGLRRAKWLYGSLLLAVFPCSIVLYLFGILSNPFYLLLALPFVVAPLKLLGDHCDVVDTERLPPLTGRFFVLFGVSFILSILL